MISGFPLAATVGWVCCDDSRSTIFFFVFEVLPHTTSLSFLLCGERHLNHVVLSPWPSFRTVFSLVASKFQQESFHSLSTDLKWAERMWTSCLLWRFCYFRGTAWSAQLYSSARGWHHSVRLYLACPSMECRPACISCRCRKLTPALCHSSLACLECTCGRGNSL